MTDEITQEKRETAKFHERRMNVGWTRRYSMINTRIQSASLMLDGTPRTEMSVAEMQQYQVSQIAAAEELEGLIQERSEHIAKILKDIPRDWLSEDAPKKLDWVEPTSQDWLMPEYSAVLSADIQTIIQDSQKKAMNLLRMSS
ncbi:MAG: hypothetical protein ACPG7F_00690 [Aggregatilineales bacterium]